MTADMSSPSEPFGLKLYRAASRATGPAARFALNRRLAKGKEDPTRIAERRGRPGAQRPDGELYWIHGASVGESLSVIPLLERLSERRPDLNFLVTTGTVTSAALMANRLPPCAIHQFAPVDHPAFVSAFLDHWRPDVAYFVESELWPNLISLTRAQVSRMALVNGRMSPTSYERWRKRPNTIRYLLAAFDTILAQDRQNAERLTELSGRPVASFGNLKIAAPALPFDDTALKGLREAIRGRPVFLAASTHPGEEEAVLAAHRLIAADHPTLLTIIAARHPERRDEIVALSQDAGLMCQLRSREPQPAPESKVYVADTLGELGVFYRLADVAFVGGSLTAKGGHNPLEPARLDCAILHGPHTFNFTEAYSEMRKSGGSGLVRNERELASAARRLLADAKTRTAMAAAARSAVEMRAESVLDDVVDALSTPSRKAAAAE